MAARHTGFFTWGEGDGGGEDGIAVKQWRTFHRKRTFLGDRGYIDFYIDFFLF